MNKREKFHTKPDFENIEVTSINTELAHTRWGAYENLSAAIDCKPNTSKYIKNLDGDYQFKLYDTPNNVEDFYNVSFDKKDFVNICVPGNWELNGHSKPIYTNFDYPWDYETNEQYMIKPGIELKNVPNPPYIPSDNPTGCYFKTFTIPDCFDQRETYIRFDGVEGAFYLWVNSEPIGYSEDSKLPVEFHITKYLKQGENHIALQVMRWSNSTYLEDQDYWHISGIYRSVWLVSKPKQCITDYKVTAIPNLHHNTGVVSIDVNVSRQPLFADYRVKVSLYDQDKNELASDIGNVAAKAQYSTSIVPTANTARITLNVGKIELWSPENPILYTAVLTLISPEGDEVDFEACKIGFKLIEVQNGVVYLNGKRLVIYGVNRHEHYYKTGRVVTKEHMLQEIIEMKRMNINSVRTCHYPDSPDWYDLCDEYGILLICECNLETHGVMGGISHNPQWAMNYLERGIRMVLNYKNHPSIYSWSLGNESGTGANHAAMAGFIRNYDTTRLCQYEAGNPGADVSDIRGNMYASIGEIMHMLCDAKDTRPIILVEYLYQIRNSGGGLDQFIELTEKYERFQGGYVWDWQDKCLLVHDENGEEFFGYGGDFDEQIKERNSALFTTNNGIVLPDLTWKPAAYEVKQAYAPIAISKANNIGTRNISKRDHKYIFRNKSQTKSLDNYDVIANIRENGEAIYIKKLAIENLSPLSQKVIEIDLPHTKKPNSEYHIDFSILQKKDTFYAKAGYEVGFSQFRLENGFVTNDMTEKCDVKLEVVNAEHDYIIKNDQIQIKISKETGCITELIKNGVNYIEVGLKPCLDRPFTGLDSHPRGCWSDIFKPFRFGNLTIEKTTSQLMKNDSEDRATIIVCQALSTKEEHYGINTKAIYTISGDGQIEVDFNIHINRSYEFVPRIGMEFIIPEGFENLSYYGYGENENYCDRMLSAKLGVYHSTVEQQHFAFIPPSENGGHEGTRWLTLFNKQGSGIKISSLKPFHFDVHHNSIEDYQQATHDHKLIRRKEAYLHMDAAHFGIVSNMHWSPPTDKQHCVEAGSYNLNFMITII